MVAKKKKIKIGKKLFLGVLFLVMFMLIFMNSLQFMAGLRLTLTTFVLLSVIIFILLSTPIFVICKFLLKLNTKSSLLIGIVIGILGNSLLYPFLISSLFLGGPSYLQDYSNDYLTDITILSLRDAFAGKLGLEVFSDKFDFVKGTVLSSKSMGSQRNLFLVEGQICILLGEYAKEKKSCDIIGTDGFKYVNEESLGLAIEKTGNSKEVKFATLCGPGIEDLQYAIEDSEKTKKALDNNFGENGNLEGQLKCCKAIGPEWEAGSRETVCYRAA